MNTQLSGNIIREKITFANRRGEQLHALLEKPGGRITAHALFAHCFTCSKDIIAASRISRALAEQGVAVLRFDFTGLGNSEGDFANTNFSSNIDDIVSAADYLQQRGTPVDILIGHSLGGAAVLAAAARIGAAKAVVTIGAPADPAHVTRLFSDECATIESDGEAQVCLAGRSFTIRKQFLDDIGTHALPERIASLRKALLVMHAPLDDVVSIDNAAKIFQAARHPRSFVTLDNADHLLTDPRAAAYAGRVIAAWCTAYVDDEPQRATASSPAAEVIVQETGDGLTNLISSGPHQLLADEPVDNGGNDRGPSPYKYLLAALGACTSMTLRLYARHKQLPLQHVSVRLRHEKIELPANGDGAAGRQDRISREIALHGELDRAQRQRLLEIANKCPVHRTLHSEIRIDSSLLDES